MGKIVNLFRNLHHLKKYSILIDDKFLSAQNKLFEKYYTHFTDDEENKLIYMDVFNQYVKGDMFPSLPLEIRTSTHPLTHH